MQLAAARALEPVLLPLEPLLTAEVVLVGGAAIPLWIDQPGAPPARATNDTDVIVAARSRVHYNRIGERLRDLDFGEVAESNMICRWRHRPTGWLYDVMPLDQRILGFTNEWYDDAFETAREVTLPGGTSVHVATPAHLVATKLVAFRDRGGGDHLASHDIHDIMALVDGCSTLADDIDALERIRGWVTRQFENMLASGAAHDAVLNYLPYDSPPDAEALLFARIERLAGR